MKSVADEVLELLCRPPLPNRLTPAEARGQLHERDRLFASVIGRSLVLKLQHLSLTLVEIA